MVQLAQHLRTRQNMTKEQILDKVYKEKMQNISILNGSEVCQMDQIQPDHLDSVSSELMPLIQNGEGVLGSATYEDTMTGFQLYHLVVYCPPKLFFFVDQLLSFESSRSILNAYVNLFNSKTVEERTTISQMEEFYHVLADTFDLNYGNILLATSTKARLEAMIDNNWPYFTKNSDFVRKCLLESDCAGTQHIIQKLGKTFLNSQCSA